MAMSSPALPKFLLLFIIFNIGSVNFYFVVNFERHRTPLEMLENIDPTRTESWSLLSRHQSEMGQVHLSTLFDQNPNRGKDYSIFFEDLLIDYSKNLLNETTMELLFQWAREAGLPKAISSMFNGNRINRTENRSVLHVALRNRSNQSIMADGKDVMPEVNAALDKMKVFSEQVNSGA